MNMDIEKVPEYRKKPDKVYDHSVDSARYIIATHPMDIFDVEIPLAKSRTNQFWENVALRMNKRKINIERYGEDFPDEDREILDALWI
jgi:hypothetical protein